MSHFLDRLTFFNRVVGDFSDGHGIVTREDRRCENDLNTSDMHPFIHPLTAAVDPVLPQSRSRRYGFHIVRLDRKHEGRALPFAAVAERVAEYLRACVERRALAQYVARLAAAARIEGIDLATPEAMRVN